ncbi:MAG: riboflavin synthase, partial [Elusimicrobiota bacterium]|nr:riboflavin synthase [Elusimicrobiota bacterium]
MFTGLVEELGVIKGITQQTLNVATQLDDIKIGDSIAINGVCLTVVKIQGDVLTFDYSPKTDELTNLSALK